MAARRRFMSPIAAAFPIRNRKAGRTAVCEHNHRCDPFPPSVQQRHGITGQNHLQGTLPPSGPASLCCACAVPDRQTVPCPAGRSTAGKPAVSDSRKTVLNHRTPPNQSSLAFSINCSSVIMPLPSMKNLSLYLSVVMKVTPRMYLRKSSLISIPK